MKLKIKFKGLGYYIVTFTWIEFLLWEKKALDFPYLFVKVTLYDDAFDLFLLAKLRSRKTVFATLTW